MPAKGPRKGPDPYCTHELWSSGEFLSLDWKRPLNHCIGQHEKKVTGDGQAPTDQGLAEPQEPEFRKDML